MPDEPKTELIACDNCDGRGKVDSRDKKSWRRFSGMHPNHPDQKAIYAGTLTPMECPKCKGTGWLKKADKSAVDELLPPNFETATTKKPDDAPAPVVLNPEKTTPVPLESAEHAETEN